MGIIKTQIKSGYVEGITTATEGVTLFKGIPFAAPPTGPLRWRPPQEVPGWDGVKKCDKFGPACPQLIGPWVEELTPKDEPTVFDEDCLYLNVWTPAQSTGDRLPVMMWIYGGGAQGGFSNMTTFDGEAIARRDVILVTINYRVNVFGFFGHPELMRESPQGACGNYGIMDQAFALKWIHENIQAFGGDPDNVTVFGQSCGGRSTICMSCSPLTKGLIRRAIVHSAGGISLAGGRLSREDIARNGEILMERMGVATLKEMRAMDAQTLMEEYSRITGDFMNSDLRFNICSDGYVMPMETVDAILAGKYHNISYMLGTTANEGGLLAVEGGDYINKENFLEEGEKQMMDRSLAYVLALSEPENDEEARQAFIDVMTVTMTASENDWAEMMPENGVEPPYIYRFNRPAPGDRSGAFHGLELWYVFGTLDRDWRPYTPEDYALSETMIDYWTNYARTGDPNGGDLARWDKYTKEKPLAMKLDIGQCGMADCEGPAVKKLKKILLEKYGSQEN